MVLLMEATTEVNMYEVAARNKKAGRIAVLFSREYLDAGEGVLDGPDGDDLVRVVAAAYGINRPSDETIAVVRELLAPA